MDTQDKFTGECLIEYGFAVSELISKGESFYYRLERLLTSVEGGTQFAADELQLFAPRELSFEDVPSLYSQHADVVKITLQREGAKDHCGLAMKVAPSFKRFRCFVGIPRHFSQMGVCIKASIARYENLFGAHVMFSI
jgi:hypothetical protein